MVISDRFSLPCTYLSSVHEGQGSRRWMSPPRNRRDFRSNSCHLYRNPFSWGVRMGTGELTWEDKCKSTASHVCVKIHCSHCTAQSLDTNLERERRNSPSRKPWCCPLSPDHPSGATKNCNLSEAYWTGTAVASCSVGQFMPLFSWLLYLIFDLTNEKWIHKSNNNKIIKSPKIFKLKIIEWTRK